MTISITTFGASLTAEQINGSSKDFLNQISKDPNSASRIIDNIVKQPGDIADLNTDVNGILNTIIGNTTNSVIGVISDKCIPNSCSISAGDNDADSTTPFGSVWVRPIVGRAKQKASNDYGNYRINTLGSTIGVDRFINDTDLVGIALGYVNNKVKFFSHQRTKMNSTLLTGYYKAAIPSDNFVQLLGSIAHSTIKITDTRGSNVIGYSTARAKPNAISLGVSAMIGHNFINTSGVALTPIFGLGHSYFKISGYTETGSTLYNLKHRRQKFHSSKVFFGLATSGTVSVNDDVDLMPSANAFIYRSFKITQYRPVVRMIGATGDFPTNMHRFSKVAYSIGVGVGTLVNKSIEGGLYYDVSFGRGFVGNQLSLKLRMMF